MKITSEQQNSSRQLALTDELRRVRLELDLAHWNLSLAALRSELTGEEEAQRSVKGEIEGRLGNLQRDVESLAGIVSRLEFRLQRLNVSHKPLSDSELDDEENTERAESATFWAEWRGQRDERRSFPAPASRKPGGKKLLSIYRKLARLIHPDLATGETDRARREVVMRIANGARDAGDTDQLQRLILLWSEPESAVTPYDPVAITARIGQREREFAELQVELKALKNSTVGRLIRGTDRDRQRYFKNEDETLRRELANLRLRRRRLLRTLDERRRELSEVSP
ncbi:hypothetical protein BH24CHL1_BH24CHL1_14000 [soil metagenome]